MPIRITHAKKKGQLRVQGEKGDARSRSEIAASGWALALHGARYVASKRVIEEDHSITMKYESDYTLSGLALSIRRREREAS